MDRCCAACSSANSSVWPTGASPLWNCSIHTRLSFEDKNSQAGRINIERQEGRSYLVAAEWDGTRLVNSGEIQDWKSTRSLKCTSDFSGELGSQRCLLKDGRLQSFCLIETPQKWLWDQSLAQKVKINSSKKVKPTAVHTNEGQDSLDPHGTELSIASWLLQQLLWWSKLRLEPRTETQLWVRKLLLLMFNLDAAPVPAGFC